MKYKVSKTIVDMYKQTNKNLNYMLDYLLSCIDPYHNKQSFQLVKKIVFDENKIEVEISEDNEKYIKSLFGVTNDELVERLLWVAVLFQEV